jgi:hypothetical protein
VLALLVVLALPLSERMPTLALTPVLAHAWSLVVLVPTMVLKLVLTVGLPPPPLVVLCLALVLTLVLAHKRKFALLVCTLASTLKLTRVESVLVLAQPLWLALTLTLQSQCPRVPPFEGFVRGRVTVVVAVVAVLIAMPMPAGSISLKHLPLRGRYVSHWPVVVVDGSIWIAADLLSNGSSGQCLAEIVAAVADRACHYLCQCHTSKINVQSLKMQSHRQAQPIRR